LPTTAIRRIALLIACVLTLPARQALSAEDPKQSITQLIDQLTQINSQTPGIDSAAIYDGFIADDTPVHFAGGVLGVPPPGIPSQMSELVRRGPSALPELIQHLDDKRPTQLQVGNDDSPKSTHQIGVDAFMFTFFSDEYDPRIRIFYSEKQRDNRPRHLDKDFQGRYTVTVGDICYVLIGQIVNRRLLSVRYQPSAGLVVNSPIEAPVIVQMVRADWGQGNPELLQSSLLADIRATVPRGMSDYQSLITERRNAAFQRLRLYFPDTYNSLQGEDLKKRHQFENPQKSPNTEN